MSRCFEESLAFFVAVADVRVSEATSSALHLRTLLRALDWAAENSYDVRALLGSLLKATSVGELYNVFLDRSDMLHR